jgi:hypothetical protein
MSAVDVAPMPAPAPGSEPQPGKVEEGDQQTETYCTETPSALSQAIGDKGRGEKKNCEGPMEAAEFSEADHNKQLVYVDTGVLDNLGLIAAFISAIGISLQSTPTYEDFELADARCFNDTSGCAPGWASEHREHYISIAHGFCCGITSTLSFMSCLLAIAARSVLPMMEDITPADRLHLAKFLRPLISLSAFMLVASLQTCTLILYYHGQVTYQREMSGSAADKVLSEVGNFRPMLVTQYFIVRPKSNTLALSKSLNWTLPCVSTSSFLYSSYCKVPGYPLSDLPLT